MLVRRLRAAILELDVDAVTRAAGADAPANAKGDPVSVAALVVALSASGGALTSLIGLLKDWLGRRGGGHRITVTVGGDSIDVASASRDEQRQLIEAFLRAREPR